MLPRGDRTKDHSVDNEGFRNPKLGGGRDALKVATLPVDGYKLGEDGRFDHTLGRERLIFYCRTTNASTASRATYDVLS